MKKYLSILTKTLLIFSLVMTTSCEDDDLFEEVAVTGSDVTSAYPMESVTLTGSNFDDVQFVFVGNRQATFQLDGDSLTFQVPEGAPIGATTITLAMANNYRVTQPFEVLLRPTPVIEAISPTAAASGEEVHITGVNLDNLESLLVGGVEANVVENAGTELTFVVPDGLPSNTPATIEIVTAGGEASSSSIFYVGENLIENGTFEAGEADEFTNWGKYNGAERLTATTAEDEAYYGRSLRAEGAAGNPWDTQFASDAAPTQVGVEYTLTMWIRTDGGTGTMRFSTAPNAQYSGDYEISSEWQQIQWVFTANEEATQIMLDLGASDAVFFIDNVTLVATGQAGPQPVELLPNGSFEEGEGDEFVGWEKFNGAELLTATTADNAVRSGSRALLAEGAGADAWRTQMASAELPTEVGTEYHVTMWIKGEPSTPGVGGSVRISTQSPAGDAMYGPDMTVSEEWQAYEWTFTANDVATRIVLDLGATEGAIYHIDDVSVEAPPAEPTVPNQNMVNNGGFEEGDGDDLVGWEVLNGADLVTATTEDEEVHSGDRAMQAIGAGGDPWLTQIASDPITTEIGTSYLVTMWIKGESGSPGVGGVIRLSTQSPEGDALYGPDMEVTDEWQQYEWVTPAATDDETKIVMDLGTTEDAVYFIDDVEVVPAEE